MGISGLLPLLKSIQVNRHLSEFSGQILGVDAYVWLHRGVYACATEIASGKKTTKYVDYAMHRIRLLRHYNIRPYVVFDGGPLPAKKGTEAERKLKRDENLARGHALSAQGKHHQARDHYVKCVDVTPQMAYQLIKALRAESIQYVVAPYEADAQLAYLERIGSVHGVITEDSDLLVFGCRTVLFKLDAVTSTVTCILRSDFGSITSAESGISLSGWSDVQFRAMAILSGCDYLPSIPGIGLKTAWSLLRKYRTPENVIRAVKLEGKKDVPRDYLRDFKLAEKVFLHQRVYDPESQRIVNMTPIPQGDVWDEKTEAFVGLDIPSDLAQDIARGDADPITLLPMQDINPIYAPRGVKTLATHSAKGTHHILNEINEVDKRCGASILHFFSRQPRPARANASGRGSGKRTLADVMEQEMTSKKRKNDGFLLGIPISSRFFGSTEPFGETSKPTPRGFNDTRRSPEKENIPLSPDASNSSLEVALGVNEPPDLVTQEDGYISPSPSYARLDTPDLSSPVRRPSHSWPTTNSRSTQDDFGVDPISSPPVAKHDSRQVRRSRSASLASAIQSPCRSTPRQKVTTTSDGDEIEGAGPDLRFILGDDENGDCGSCYGEFSDHLASPSSAMPSHLVTPDHLGRIEVLSRDMQFGGDVDLGFESERTDPGESERQATTLKNEAIAPARQSKWALNGKPQSSLKRHETTVTDGRRHRPIQSLTRPPRPRATIQDSVSSSSSTSHNLHRRRSLDMVAAVRKASRSEDALADSVDTEEEISDPDGVDKNTLRIVHTKLAQFRYDRLANRQR